MYVYVFNVCFHFVMTQVIRVLGCIRMEPILHAGACLWHAGACVDTLNPSFCKSSMYVFDFLMPQVILHVCFAFEMTQVILHVCFAF